MKRKIMVVVVVFLMTDFLIQQASAIGISPGRTTRDLLEYNCTFNSSIGYTLTRPSSARYSMFSVYDAAGMNGTITGCSASNSFEYIDNKNILIDWQSNELLSVSTTTATINIQSPQSWNCPAVPGGNSYMTDLVRHSEVVNVGSGISVGVAAVSQISLWRNYALRGTVTGLQETYTSNQAVQFGVDVVDYFIGQGLLNWFDFSYSIDWESDGIVDNSLSGIRMADELGRTDGYSIYAGYKYKDLSLEHIYSAPGDYLITLSLRDMEATSLTIPVHVVPEPATLLLFGLGGLFLRKYKSSINNHFSEKEYL